MTFDVFKVVRYSVLIRLNEKVSAVRFLAVKILTKTKKQYHWKKTDKWLQIWTRHEQTYQ